MFTWSTTARSVNLKIIIIIIITNNHLPHGRNFRGNGVVELVRKGKVKKRKQLRFENCLQVSTNILYLMWRWISKILQLSGADIHYILPSNLVTFHNLKKPFSSADLMLSIVLTLAMFVRSSMHCFSSLTSPKFAALRSSLLCVNVETNGKFSLHWTQTNAVFVRWWRESLNTSGHYTECIFA